MYIATYIHTYNYDMTLEQLTGQNTTDNIWSFQRDIYIYIQTIGQVKLFTCLIMHIAM